jgi:hypothetical protein
LSQCFDALGFGTEIFDQFGKVHNYEDTGWQ